MKEVVAQGLIASAFGIGGVFLVLILFYVVVKLMRFIFRKMPSE